jgi:hypothetical protein
MNTKIKNIVFFLAAFLIIVACEEEYQQPYNIKIEPSESGLEGRWEGVALTRDFAVQLLDSLGNTVTDDKNRTVWNDTSVTVTQDKWNEYIEFQILPAADTFTISNSLDSLNLGTVTTVLNMPLSTGHWALTKTLDPENESNDVLSLTFYDPEDPHNSLSSILWTITEQSPEEITFQYSFGSSSYDTLFTKTFQKL